MQTMRNHDSMNYGMTHSVNIETKPISAQETAAAQTPNLFAESRSMRTTI